MRLKHMRACFLLTLLFSCTAKEQEPIDYDSMAMAMEEEEWTSLPDEKGLITDLTPELQEQVIIEIPE